jgi:hypothetical protein
MDDYHTIGHFLGMLPRMGRLRSLCGNILRVKNWDGRTFVKLTTISGRHYGMSKRAATQLGFASIGTAPFRLCPDMFLGMTWRMRKKVNMTRNAFDGDWEC